ncbi:PREDICTED: uncharacterized protein LOC108558737 [Nicrophorus vespilloides]|uniref:Uncharacterized protein LOC108558737 n=1 Tax=Nicrophorus vespilloides TaxID=110193 RepID=A0ABM1M9I8_NICVS|nr:PREDICTED: uncharacterized protein LOC108558737 [Nicrophorus vespilloides]
MMRFAIALMCVFLAKESAGHGMLLDPPNRSSLWRFDDEAPINYNDNENFCGGANVQWQENGGKCGVCGDNYRDPHPQKNENTGLYGQGKIVANYTSGEIIETYSLLTANHLGHFEFDLCVLEDVNAIEPGDDCFIPLRFVNREYKFPITKDDYQVINRLQLPEGFECEHCVLRWIYVGGNNWGLCEDGSYALGCGPQESFRSCADISIL